MNFKEFLLEATTELSSWMRFIKKGINSPDNYLILADKVEDLGAPLLAQYIRKASEALTTAYSRGEYQTVQPDNLITRELRKFGVYSIDIRDSLEYYTESQVDLTKPIIKNQSYFDYTDYYSIGNTPKSTKITNIAEPEEGPEPQPDHIVKDKKLHYPVWIYPNGMVTVYYGAYKPYPIKTWNNYFGDASKKLSIIDVNNLGLQLAYLYITAYKIRKNPNAFLDTNKVTPHNYQNVDNLLFFINGAAFDNQITAYFMQNFLKMFAEHVRAVGIMSPTDLATIANRLLELEVRGSEDFHAAALDFANNIPDMKTPNKILYNIGKLYRSI